MDKITSLLEPGILTIGCDASAPGPMHSDNPNSPDFEGFEVDLMKSVASRLKLSIKYKSALWIDLVNELKQGKLDVICTAATITAERQGIFDFSHPYLECQLAVTVNNQSPIQNLGDLENKVIGAQLATIAEDFVRKNVKAKEIRPFRINVDAYGALRVGELDAIVDDSPIAQWFVMSTPELKLATHIAGTDFQYALMFRKGNDELREAVNNILTQIEADGSYDKFYKKWFGEITLKRG